MTILKQAMVADIPVLWAEPATQAPRKLVIWLPGFSGSKESVQNNLLDLAAAGFVGLSFDPCQHGAAFYRGPQPGYLCRTPWTIRGRASCGRRPRLSSPKLGQLSTVVSKTYHLKPEVVDRATPAMRRIYGFDAQPKPPDRAKSTM